MPYSNDAKPTNTYSNDSGGSSSFGREVKPINLADTTWGKYRYTWADELNTWQSLGESQSYTNDTK